MVEKCGFKVLKIEEVDEFITKGNPNIYYYFYLQKPNLQKPKK